MLARVTSSQERGCLLCAFTGEYPCTGALDPSYRPYGGLPRDAGRVPEQGHPRRVGLG